MSWAPTTGAPSGRAEVLATARAVVFCPGVPVPAAVGVDEGVSAGNRFPALPPGLRVELWPEPGPVTNGSSPRGSGDVVVPPPLPAVEAAEAAVTAVVTDATGSLGRCAAVPVTFR